MFVSFFFYRENNIMKYLKIIYFPPLYLGNQDQRENLDINTSGTNQWVPEVAKSGLQILQDKPKPINLSTKILKMKTNA